MDKPTQNNFKADSFNRAYDKKGMYYGWDVRPEFNDFFDQMKLTGCQALDLGAGEGRYTVYLARRGCAVTAVDFSSSGLNKINIISDRNRLSVVTELSDLSTYVYKAEAYDLVVAATILDHLEAPVRKRTIEGIFQSLKPEGLLYVNVFTTQDPGYGITDQAARDGVSDTSFGMAHYFSPGELKACFSCLKLLYYYEGVEADVSHGRPHRHGWASLIGRKV